MLVFKLMYPMARLRRNRQYGWLRDLVSENQLLVTDMIMPFFVESGKSVVRKIDSMPGVCSYSVDTLISRVQEASNAGIRAIMLFPVVDGSLKDEMGREALNKDNILCRAIEAVKGSVPEIGIIADVALDPYTTHGHDGVLNDNGFVMNDETVSILCQQAVVLAEAGADIIAPSDMMDGRIGAIRKSLDGAGYVDVPILSYAAKYASALYGPFRDAVRSSGLLRGDKRSYQMSPANVREAFLEVAADIQEGADIVMIKPASLYADIICSIRSRFDVPIFAYQVSGEYAAYYAAHERGWLDLNSVMYESLLGIKRAGACSVVTYHALEMAKFIVSRL